MIRLRLDFHLREVERYRTALEVIEAVSAHPPVVSPSGDTTGVERSQATPRTVSRGRRTADLVLSILNSDGREWLVADLVDAMDTAGWDSSVSNKVNTVRTALARMADRGTVRRVRAGTYQGLDSPTPDGKLLTDELPPEADSDVLAQIESGSFAFTEART